MADETIEVRYKFINTSPVTGNSYYHKYIVYTDSSGNHFAARGGPSKYVEGIGQVIELTETEIGIGGTGFGYIETTYGEYDDDFIDWDFETDDVGETIISGSDLSAYWDDIKQAMDDIESEQHTYRPLDANSNTTVDEALRRAGLSEPTLDNLYNSPASGKELPEGNGDYDETLLRFIPDWVEGIINKFFQAENNASPLVLDIDGDGIELAALNGTGSVYWDIDLDGFAEASGWIAGGDGLLAIDLNFDGIINNHAELFGDQTGSNNGFAALAVYDTNTDGSITSVDTQFDDLLVWIDVNSDGYSQADELHTLDDLSITAINLAYTDVSYTISGNEILQESTFTINGQTRDIVDAWFAYDNVNTAYAQEYTLDVRTLFLPTLRGYGNLPDLHIAMSLNEDLLDMVETVATADLETLLDPTFDVEGKIQAIMYEWAGVTDVAVDSRGVHMQDARKLEFIEEMMGKEYVQLKWGWDDPGPTPALNLENAFTQAFENFYARILSQTEMGTLLEGNVYNPITDTFSGFTDIDSAVFSDIETLATTSEDALYHWQQVLRLVSHSVGLSSLDSTDLTALLNASISSGTVINGTSGNDGALNGTNDNEAIFGFEGNDYMTGSGGSDTLIGGAGYDTMWGGTGNDIYVFASGFGAATTSNPDWIGEYANEGNDTIYIQGDLTPEDIRFWTDSSGSFFLKFIDSADDVARGSVGTNSNGTRLGEFIELIIFESGTSWNLNEGLYLSGDDNINNIYGAANDDIINGYGGNDTLYGYGGNDILIGGSGRDSYRGGDGNDTYQFEVGFGHSSGVETIYENLSEGDDMIYITGTLTPDDVYFWTDYAGGYHIQFVATPDDHIQGTVGTDSDGTKIDDYIEYISFETGASWDLREGLYLNDSNDGHQIYGAENNDVIKGNGGHDQIRGFGGNDILIGGSGRDIYYGGAGDDTYEFEAGFGDALGAESITENIGEGTDTIYIKGSLTPDDVYFWTDTAGSGAFHLQFAADPDDYVMGIAGFDANGTTVFNRIEYISFESGTIWDLSQALYLSDNDDGHYVRAAATDDIIKGNGGNDHLYGYAGNDILDGGTGNDVIYGGTGTDTVSFASSASAVTANLSTNSATGDGTDYLYELENITGSAFDDTLTGDSNDNVLDGGAGNDTLTGGNGNDSIHGGSGTDTVSYAAAASVVNVNLSTGTATGAGTDTLYEIENIIGSANADTLTGDAGDNTFVGGLGNDTIDGGAGIDTVDYSGNSQGVYIDLLIGIYDETGDMTSDDSLSNIENIIGSSYADYLKADNGVTSVIYGGDGDDVIDGGSAIDELHGGDGDDTITGYGGADTIYGDAGEDELIGSGDNDTIYGGADNDDIKGKEGEDILYGDGGDDTIRGFEDNDILYGGDGDDYLYGGINSTDTFSSDDILYGGDGLDRMWGLNGADTFVFESASAFNDIDLVKDFDLSENDKIDISDLLSLYDPLTDVITDFVQITTHGSHSNLYVDIDGGADNFVQIAQLQDVTGLTDEAALETSGNLITV